MSPDQVTRAAPGKSSNVSPGDSIGGIVFWGKEIMYHRQQKKKNLSPVPPKSGQAAALSCEEQERGIKCRGSWWLCGSGYWRRTRYNTHTHNEEKKSVLISEQTPPFTRALRRLTHGEEKSHRQPSVHWKMDGRTYCKSPSATRPWKDPDAGKHWRQEEKGMTDEEVVGWHHRLNRHEFEQAPGVDDRQRSLAWCSP